MCKSCANFRAIVTILTAQSRYEKAMKQTCLSVLAVMMIAALLCGCEAKTGAAQQAPGSQSAEDAERKKADQEVAARARQEHPDWSEKQISDYVKGYNGFAISPETYAKTRAVLDSARSLRCQFPKGSYVDLADPKLGRH